MINSWRGYFDPYVNLVRRMRFPPHKNSGHIIQCAYVIYYNICFMFSLYWDYYACLMCFKCRFNTGAQTRLFLGYRGVYARALTTVGPDEKGLVFLHFFSYLYRWRGWVVRSLFRKDQVFRFFLLCRCVLNNFRA